MSLAKMSTPLQDASSASAAPIAAASRHDSSWIAIAEHFAKRCLCHRETTHPQCPDVKARGAPQFPPHPWPPPNKPSPPLHHLDARPPAKYPLCSVHPAL